MIKEFDEKKKIVGQSLGFLQVMSEIEPKIFNLPDMKTILLLIKCLILLQKNLFSF